MLFALPVPLKPIRKTSFLTFLLLICQILALAPRISSAARSLEAAWDSVYQRGRNATGNETATRAKTRTIAVSDLHIHLIVSKVVLMRDILDAWWQQNY